MIDLLSAIFQKRFGSQPKFISRAPGRVNLLGEHVDYNEGFVLPAAIDRTVWVVFSPSQKQATTIVAADFREEDSFNAGSILEKRTADGNLLKEWAHYPAGVAWAIGEAGYPAPPMDAVFGADIPRGSGLSSSAGVEMAFTSAWQKLGGWDLPPMKRALLGQKAENQYVGVNCGIMDQFASACGRSDRLLYLDCRSLDYSTLPLPENIVIVIADTGVRRSLTHSGYNDRRNACEEAVRILANKFQGIRSLRDVSLDDFNNSCQDLPKIVEKRARHVVEEMARSCRAVYLLEEGRIAEFGSLMNDCHRSLRDLYQVSIPELDKMTEIAQELPGCIGARLTGAGFGGCTVNLVEKDKASHFAEELGKRYTESIHTKPEIYICRAADGAGLIE